MDSKKENTCDFCKGRGVAVAGKECVYCNGTGEWNAAAQAYVKNHICQCINWDRRNCPVCMKKCHHSSSQSNKQIIDPGHGGQSVAKNWDDQEKDIAIEMDNFA